MMRVVAVSLKWVEVIVNLPTEATFQSSRAALLADVGGLGFLGIGEPIDDIAALRALHFRASFPAGTAGLPGQTTVFLGRGREPGMILDFTGTGNQPVTVSVHNEAAGAISDFPATELLSGFDIQTGAHIGEMDLDLSTAAPSLVKGFDVRTLKLRAKLIPAVLRPPDGDLLAWLQSSDGDLARQAVPGIASALRHNPDAVSLGGGAWISEIESALIDATRLFLADPPQGQATVAQLERLLAFVLQSG